MISCCERELTHYLLTYREDNENDYSLRICTIYSRGYFLIVSKLQIVDVPLFGIKYKMKKCKIF